MGEIQVLAPPADFTWALESFVMREAQGAGIPVLLLPEIRPSIQVFVQDPYWIRRYQETADWAKVGKVSLWGPRYELAYGWSEPNIRVFGMILTAAGCRALTGQPPSHFANRTAGLSEKIAQKLWAAASAEGGVDKVTPQLSSTLASILEKGELTSELKSTRLCERQQRRRFVAEWGISAKTQDRFQRLDHLIRSLHAQPWESPGLSPPELGFFDQSHMIRECVKMTSLTPFQIKRAMQRSKSAAMRSIEMPHIDLPKTT
jgi:hypothetical protein